MPTDPNIMAAQDDLQPEPGDLPDSERGLAATPGSTKRPFNWPGTAMDAIVCLVVLLLGTLIAPGMLAPEIQPKRAVLLAVIPLGVVTLVRLIQRRDRSALAGLAFLTWAGCAAAFSPAPWPALIGVVNRDQSVLLYLACLSLWSMGRFTSERGRLLLASSLAVVLAVNGVVAVAQLAAESKGILDLYLGRPTGLVVSPVVLGALAASTAVWSYLRWEQSGRWVELVGYGSSVYLATLTATRIALLVCLVPLLVGVLRRIGVRMSALAAVAGILGAWLTHAILGGGDGLASQGDPTGSTGDRLTNWAFGFSGWLEHPITGVGVGRFHVAVQQFASDEWVGRFPGQGWKDAHNLLVELLVVVGLPGLVLFATFVYLSARQASGPLAWMALAIAATWTLQPATIVTLPVVAALLGASQGVVPSSDTRLAGIRWQSGSVLAGLMLTASLVIGDGQIDGYIRRGSGPPLGGAAIWYNADPEVLKSLASAEFDIHGNEESGDSRLTLEWAEQAIEAEPDNATWWSELAMFRYQAGQSEAAREAADRALDLRPNDLKALEVTLLLARDRGDREAGSVAVERMCSIFEDGCDPERLDEFLDTEFGERSELLSLSVLEDFTRHWTPEWAPNLASMSADKLSLSRTLPSAAVAAHTST